MPSKIAGETQVAWALLTEGVAKARLDAHRLRHLLTRAQTLVEKSEAKEHFYQQAGDLLLSIPTRMDALERTLDRTSYALSILGADHLRDRLSMSERSLVDDATFSAKPFGGTSPRSSTIVAYRYLQKQADLNPPLGEPGGLCHLMRRIKREVRDPRLQQELIEDVETGLKIENRDAAKIYRMQAEPYVNKKILLPPHAQYRMDQRGVAVEDVEKALHYWYQGRKHAYMISQKTLRPLGPKGKPTVNRDPITWTAPNGLTLVFKEEDQNTITLITTYWKGVGDPKPVERETCPI